MKAVLSTLVIWASLVLASYAQNPGAMAIRSRIEQGMLPNTGQAPTGQGANPVDEWQQVRKLTLLRQVPPSPRAQEACLPATGLSEGAVGYLECWPMIVAQVFGPNDALLALGDAAATPILLTGYPTQGLVSGQKVGLVGPIEVVAMKSLPAIPGGKPVPVVQLLTEEQLAELKTKPAAGAAAKEARKWTDSAGKFSVVATFVEFKNGQVHLKREDGKVLEVPVARLSSPDQKWVRDELARRMDAKRKAAGQ